MTETENFNEKLEEAGFYRVLLESTTHDANSQGFPLQYCLGLKTIDLAKAVTKVRDLIQAAEKWNQYEDWFNKNGDNATQSLLDTIKNRLIYERMDKEIKFFEQMTHPELNKSYSLLKRIRDGNE